MWSNRGLDKLKFMKRGRCMDARTIRDLDVEITDYDLKTIGCLSYISMMKPALGLDSWGNLQ